MGDYRECGSHRKEKKGDEERLIFVNCDGLLQMGKVLSSFMHKDEGEEMGGKYRII